MSYSDIDAFIRVNTILSVIKIYNKLTVYHGWQYIFKERHFIATARGRDYPGALHKPNNDMHKDAFRLIFLHSTRLYWLIGWQRKHSRVDVLPNSLVKTQLPFWKPHLAHLSPLTTLLNLTPTSVGILQYAHNCCGVDS